MTAEREKEYFRNFESKALPDISWQEMIDRKVVFSPDVVLKVLHEAEDLLVTHPGPNLEEEKY